MTHEVHEYSEQCLRSLCLLPRKLERSDSYRLRGEDEMGAKPQLRYIANYLKELDCKTVIAEEEYVDHDYLDDYATYYSRCYQGYRRKCLRLHFFDQVITPGQYGSFLGTGEGATRDTLTSSYLGFVVLRPLPEAFIGRTCLKRYPPNAEGGHSRQYPATFGCKSHLAGLALKTQSLPFQEQDTVVAACATTAIWAAFQRMANLFRMEAPTPARITAMATEHGHQHSRVLPSQGLELGQMCRTFLSSGLEVEVRNGEKLATDASLKELVHAYGALGLPAILGLQPLQDPGDDRHAVAIAGYAMATKPAPPPQTLDLALAAHAMERLYVHDDQVGPFLSCEFQGVYSPSIRYTRAGDGSTSSVFALVIPVYPKIRIRYESAKDAVVMFDGKVRALFGVTWTWDIRLVLGQDVLAELGKDAPLSPKLRSHVAAGAYPRFVWLASAADGATAQVALLLDATDIERSNFVHEILFLNESFAVAMQHVLSDETSSGLLQKDLERASTWRAKVSKGLTLSESVE